MSTEENPEYNYNETVILEAHNALTAAGVPCTDTERDGAGVNLDLGLVTRIEWLICRDRHDKIDEATAIATQLAHHAPGADAQTLAEHIRAGLWHRVASEIVRSTRAGAHDVLDAANVPIAVNEATAIADRIRWLTDQLDEVTKQRDEGTIDNQALAKLDRSTVDRIQRIVGLHTERVTYDMIVEAVEEAVYAAEALEVDVAMLEEHVENIGKAGDPNWSWMENVWEGWNDEDPDSVRVVGDMDDWCLEEEP